MNFWAFSPIFLFATVVLAITHPKHIQEIRPYQGCACCPSGWLMYEGSCYLFVRHALNYQDAWHYCHERNASLAVLRDQDEMTDVLQHGIVNAHTWIGLSADFIPSADVLTWQTTGGMHFHEVPWLTPLAPKYGQTSRVACAAYFNPLSDAISPYVHFYDCFLARYFVCELNETSTDMKASLSSVLYQLLEDEPPQSEIDRILEETVLNIMHEEIEPPTTPIPLEALYHKFDLAEHKELTHGHGIEDVIQTEVEDHTFRSKIV